LLLLIIQVTTLRLSAQDVKKANDLLKKTDQQFFIENKGQWPSEVLYLTRSGNLYDDEENLIYQNTTTLGTLKHENFEIYPNPNYAGGQLTISYKLNSLDNASLILYDVVGQVIMQTTLSPNSNKVLINLNHSLGSGIYKVVLVRGDNILGTKKLTIVD
jgi:hypothetical protein